MTLKDGVDGSGLNCGWVLIAHFLDGLKKGWDEGEFIKWGHDHEPSVHLSEGLGKNKGLTERLSDELIVKA